jgi:Family of unknown function (DUF5343)
MADTETRRSYPKLPVSNWWTLRRQFQKSPPRSVDNDYLMSVLGLSSSGAAANILAALRSIGLVDENNATGPLAQDWRSDETYANACEHILKAVYPDSLRDAFPPPDPDVVGVQRWFARNAGVGDAAARKMTAFYQLLCNADPKGGDATPTPSPARKVMNGAVSKAAKPAAAAKPKVVEQTPLTPPPPGAVQLGGVGGITINIELQVPATADSKFFDELFASMRKHLISKNS